MPAGDDTKNPLRASAIEKQQDEDATKLAEMISSKKYALDIKEKRTKPLLVFSVLPAKHKKAAAKPKKSSKQDKKPAAKSKKSWQVVVLVALVIGLYLAIDMGWLDLGFKLPFSIFGE